MNFLVNPFWAYSLVRYIGHCGHPTTNLLRLLNASNRKDASLTTVQAAVAMGIAQDLCGDEYTAIKAATKCLATDYRFIGLLLECAPDPLYFLGDKDFLQRHVAQKIEVKKTTVSAGTKIAYILPEGTSKHIYSVVAHFLVYADRCMARNSFGVRLSKIVVNGSCIGIGKDAEISVGGDNKNHSEVECTNCEAIFIAAPKKQEITDTQRLSDNKNDVFDTVRSLVKQDKNGFVEVSLAARVSSLSYKNVQNAYFGHHWVAKELGMCERKLQKKLRQENTSYRKIVDDVRKDLANTYLRKQRYSVTETAYMLGYTATSNFIRAYRRWWGCSPTFAMGNPESILGGVKTREAG